MTGFYNATRFNAACTDIYFFYPPVPNRPDPLKIGVETTIGYIVRMADIMTEHRFFPANFTHFRHGLNPFYLKNLHPDKRVAYIIDHR